MSSGACHGMLAPDQQKINKKELLMLYYLQYFTKIVYFHLKTLLHWIKKKKKKSSKDVIKTKQESTEVQKLKQIHSNENTFPKL